MTTHRSGFGPDADDRDNKPEQHCRRRELQGEQGPCEQVPVGFQHGTEPERVCHGCPGYARVRDMAGRADAGGSGILPRMWSAAFSPIMIVGALVFDDVT
jgi:hypothetical protein